MRQQSHDSYEWIISEVRDEAPRVRSLILKAIGERPSFISGQYFTVRLPNFEPAEGKSYSISSSEKDSLVRLTIKEMGLFSEKILAHSVGDTLTTSAPYGFFYPEKGEVRDLVFVAGGIGIAPCMSIVETYCQENYEGHISIFYSNQTIASTIFKEQLDTLEREYDRFSVTYHITREITLNTEYAHGRISGATVCASVPNPYTSDYFICGSIDFTKNLWKELRSSGVENSQLYTEGFF